MFASLKRWWDGPQPAPQAIRAASQRTELNEQSEQARRGLREIVANGQITAGCFHLIGLQSLRERLGVRWTAAADRVHLLTEKLLKQHLDERDVWFLHDDDVYVVVFSRLGKSEAQLLCGKIIQELHMLLLGDVDTASITVETAVITHGAIEMEANPLSDLIRRAIGSIDASGDFSPPAPEPDPIPESAYFGLAELPSWATENQTVKERPPEILYRPIWDSMHQVISRYGCAPARIGYGPSHHFWHDVLLDPADVHQVFDLDVHVLCVAVEAMYQNHKHNMIVPIVIPVHFETLAVQARRRQFISLCRRFPRPLIPFTTLEVLGLPHGVPASRMVEVVNSIQPFCRTVFVATRPDTNDLPALVTAGVKVVRTTLRSGGGANNNLDVSRFLLAARKCQVVTCLDGIKSLSDFETAQAIRAPLLAGPFIGEWLPSPGAAMRRSKQDFVQAAAADGQRERAAV